MAYVSVEDFIGTFVCVTLLLESIYKFVDWGVGDVDPLPPLCSLRRWERTRVTRFLGEVRGPTTSGAPLVSMKRTGPLSRNPIALASL